MKLRADTERELAQNIARFYYDPLGFVMFVFPWGQPGTPLANKDGPEKWQAELLVELGKHCIENKHRKDLGLDYIVWRSAVASGHGVGKSALVAWIIYWIMSTRLNARGVVTANTGNQLETKTWPELSKWHGMAINRHWFQWTAQTFFFAQYPEDKRKNYMVNATTVSEENTEAFAGLHNEGSAVFVIMDEASGISEKIYEVVDGAVTDGEPFVFCFGNPTRPSGPFHSAFTKDAGLYTFLKHVDSRDVRHTNKNAIEDIIRKYGIDSDVVKYRVLGQFPSRSFDGFISPADVHDATIRELTGDTGAPLILGIDVARYGDDSTVFCYRRGRDARSLRWLRFNGMNTTQVTEIAAKEIAKYKPDAVIIESIGPGVGVIDQLRARNIKVIEVHPGSAADKFEVFANKRAEWWDRMRTWLREHGCIPEDPELFTQLTEILYKIGEKTGKQQMEDKADMKGRGLSSPDKADALALTFATTVNRRANSGANPNRGQLANMDYDVHA
jgi:hypothetical protein